MENIEKIVGAGVLFTLAIAVIVAAPFLIIWSLNILFVLQIPFTLKTWLAVQSLTFLTRSCHIVHKKKD